MMKRDQEKEWSAIEGLEDRTLGMFVGGLLLSLDDQALSKEPADPCERLSQAANEILDSVGARRIPPKRADTPQAMKAEMASFFKQNAEMANLAARGFENLPDEAAESIYEEFIELREKVKRRGR